MHEAGEPRLPLISFLERRIRWISVLLSVTCVAYFYALDRVFFSSAHFSPIFRRLLTVEDFRVAWFGLAICLLAAAWRRPNPILRLVDSLGHHPCLWALATAVMGILGAVGVYHAYPLSMDEYAAVFQAKIFASGHLAAWLPRDLLDWLVVRGFNGEFLVASPETGRAVEHYWPGFALLLAPFEFFKVPWLCNAALSGLALGLIHRITREITGERDAAGWALLFTVASGVFAAQAISYYSMQAHLTANLLFVALLLKPTGCRALGAGLVGSLALTLHNPVPHTLFAIPWIVAMAAEQSRRRHLLPLMLGYLPGVALGIAWLVFRARVWPGAPDASSLRGAATSAFAWPGETLLNMRTAALVKMWVWMPPGLLVFAVLGRLRQRDNPHVRLLMQSAALTFVGYLFVRFDQGHGWGYRYFYSAWGAVPILAACAMSDGASTEGEGQSRLVVFAGAAAVLNLFLVMPFQLHQINDFIAHHVAQLPPPQRPGNNVYFIHPRGGFYVADMVQIDPLLRDPDLLLVSRGAQLDADLILRNWPEAVHVGSGKAADQWYLGPKDRRVPISGWKDQKHFVFATAP